MGFSIDFFDKVWYNGGIGLNFTALALGMSDGMSQCLFVNTGILQMAKYQRVLVELTN